MTKKITNILYKPVIYFFLLPLISLLPGSLLALQYGQINYISLTALYTYIVVNQFIENILLRIPTNEFQLSKKLLIGLEIINILFILFFSFYYSWISISILILYTLTIQTQFLFSYYDLEEIASLLVSFLKVIILNSISFYIHTNFVYSRFFPYFFGLFLPYFIYELTRPEKKIANRTILTLTGINYLFIILFLWKDIRFLSFFLISTLPFIIKFNQTLKRKYMATFLIVFSIIYIGLLILIFIK